MDDDMKRVILSVGDELRDHEIEPWFTAVCEAYDPNGDRSRFKEALRTQVEQRSVSTKVFDTFAEFMERESNALRTLESMVALGNDLPGIYGDLVRARDRARQERAAQERAARERAAQQQSAAQQVDPADIQTVANDAVAQLAGPMVAELSRLPEFAGASNATLAAEVADAIARKIAARAGR